jgi:outer membrane biosynthesis protein TonB
VTNEPAEPSTPKVDSKKKPTGKTSLQKPRESAKAAAKPVAQAERQSTEPARPKEAERSPQPAQDAGNPTTAAPVTATTVQQRFADGMTHAFSYLVHLPGALVPHPADPNADGH